MKKNKKMDIILGKPIDIMSLKIVELENFKRRANNIKQSRTKLYKGNLIKVDFCPICQRATDKNLIVFEVYGAKYVQCRECLHCYVLETPSKKALDRFYSQDKEYHKIYTDKRTTDIRINQVAVPKVKWIINEFKRIYGSYPRSLLDVGAGGGHFVKACRDLGINADGIEISKNARDFCQKSFGFKLINKDFIKEWNTFKDYDIITFWSVIEHVSNPLLMLSAASKIISGKKGFVVSDVPRWNSFSTVVQKVFPDLIIRHLDPLGHVHCFTDASLSKAYQKSNLDIVAKWYFGMDAYELITQMSNLIGKKDNIGIFKNYIPYLQKKIDLAGFSDEMVFIGKPL